MWSMMKIHIHKISGKDVSYYIETLVVHACNLHDVSEEIVVFLKQASRRLQRIGMLDLFHSQSCIPLPM